MTAPRSEHIGSVKGRTRAMEQVDVTASVGPKRRMVTLAGPEGSIDIDASAIDELQVQLDLAKRWLGTLKAAPMRAKAA